MDKINSAKDTSSKLKFINRFTLAHMLSGHYVLVVAVGIPQYLSVMKRPDLNGVGLFGMNDLIWLFVIRNERELLLRLFSSECIASLCMEYSSEAIGEALKADPALALLLYCSTYHQLESTHTLDDIFLIRCLIVKALEDVINSYEEKRIPEKTLSLLSILDLDIPATITIWEKQKKLLMETYERFYAPSPKQQEMYNALLSVQLSL